MTKRQQQPAESIVRFRDRIVELRRVKASELIDNQANWRRHPDDQVSAVTSIMEKIGFAGAAIGRIVDGKVELLDGHLRKGIAGDAVIPVLITDLDDNEAKIFLASYDPLSDLAIADADALHKLLSDTADADDDAFLRKLMADAEQELADEIGTKDLEPHEHYDYLVVLCQTSNEWNVLCDKLGLKPEQRRSRMGTARAIRATALLPKIAK